MKKPEQCRAGHTMSTENIYWDSKPGVAYPVCRTCRAARTRKRYRETSLTKAERDELNKRPVIQNYNIKKHKQNTRIQIKMQYTKHTKTIKTQ